MESGVPPEAPRGPGFRWRCIWATALRASLAI